MSQPQPTTSLSGSLFRLILLISSFPLRETIYIHEYEGFGETASVSQRHRPPKYVSRLHPPMEIEDRIFWLVIQHGQYVSKGKVRSEREEYFEKLVVIGRARPRSHCSLPPSARQSIQTAFGMREGEAADRHRRRRGCE